MSEFNSFSRLGAEEDWNQARRKALYQGVVCFFKKCSVDLLSFDDVRTKLDLLQRIDRGLQEIPLDRVRGSVGRATDFNSAFLPRKKHMRERWERVDVAMREGKTPPIDVYQVGEAYFVVDGNHRVSIARQFGAETIEAYVTEFLTPFALGPEANIDELLIRTEQKAFFDRIGQICPPAMRNITFTCHDCYGDLMEMIDIYHQGQQEAAAEPVSLEQSVFDWYEEVYVPAVALIRDNDLLARFPQRTEADLFIWAWKNNQAIEELVLQEDPTAGQDL